jgi:glucokinase
LLFGKEFRASRLGHTTLYKNGRPCPCGKKGCIEAYISAKGLLKTAEINGSNFFDVNEIFTCEDHNLIAKIVEEFTNDLISVIENYNAIFDPEVIIIGGGLIMTTDFWWDRLMEKNQTNIKIVPADLGNDSGIIGIAYLAENNFIEGE